MLCSLGKVASHCAACNWKEIYLNITAVHALHFLRLLYYCSMKWPHMDSIFWKETKSSIFVKNSGPAFCQKLKAIGPYCKQNAGAKISIVTARTLLTVKSQNVSYELSVKWRSLYGLNVHRNWLLNCKVLEVSVSLQEKSCSIWWNNCVKEYSWKTVAIYYVSYFWQKIESLLFYGMHK